MAQLVLEERPLSPHSSTVSRELSIASYDSVTRNDNGQPILSIRSANGAAGGRTPHPLGYIRVAAGLSVRNLQQLYPDGALEFTAGENHGQLELSARSLKVLSELAVEHLDVRMRPRRHHTVQSSAHDTQLYLQHTTVRKFQQCDTLIICGAEHGAEGRE
jgi:hypothetical protein